MANVNEILEQRLKKGGNTSKMAEMGRQSVQGQLTSFSGIFSISDLNTHEKESLRAILDTFATEKDNLDHDLHALIAITSEVKAINNQAALLHGERIKQAQTILIRYKEGAFTAWLMAAYGNRQTPYNFLQYYEFYEALPKPLRPRLESMPRQAVYTLASRKGPMPLKLQLVETYQGETKTQLLDKIREAFPLELSDKRKQDHGEQIVQALTKLVNLLETKKPFLTKNQKQLITTLLDDIHQFMI